ncbi:hypothetical protein ACUXLG_003510 [Ralstonia sp. 121560039-2]
MPVAPRFAWCHAALWLDCEFLSHIPGSGARLEFVKTLGNPRQP